MTDLPTRNSEEPLIASSRDYLLATGAFSNLRRCTCSARLGMVRTSGRHDNYPLGGALGTDLSIQAVSVDYTLKGRNFTALSQASIDVPAGTTVSLVGPSGCGKTTLLNVIGGFIRATSGHVLVGGIPVSGPGAERAMVFQADAVFPWLTVRQNLLYGPRIRKALDSAALARCDKYLELMGLAAFADEYPKVLSGGMRKRVDVARAYVNDSAIVLLDEPFGALDDFTKSYLQDELIHLSLVEPKTTVFVTHDIEEAIYVGDVVVVMATRPGRVAEHIEVPFPRDRVASIKDSDEFQQVRQRIQRLLRQELTSAMHREDGAA